MTFCIGRREFVTLLCGAAAWPLAARAQQTKVYRIGALLVGNADVDSFRTGYAKNCADTVMSKDKILSSNFSRGMANQEADETMAQPDLAKGANP
jgi:hypothetical protein